MMLGDIVTVTVDRPIGSHHPDYPDMVYPINYGYIKGVIAPDGEEQDAYILGVDEPISEFRGRVIAVIYRFDDVENKLVVAPCGVTYSEEEIVEKTYFQERYFNIRVELFNDLNKGGKAMKNAEKCNVKFTDSMKLEINQRYSEVLRRITERHIGCFRTMQDPLFLISEQYPGLWLEHVYDSVFLARLEPRFIHVAQNAVNLFIDRQSDGQLPFCVIDGNKVKADADTETVLYSQIQECVSFFSLALEVYEMNGDTLFLEKAYEAGKRWDEWLRAHRMTGKRGLVEMFVGFDTGHDNSGRLSGMACPGNYRIDGVRQNAAILPPDDGVTPIIAVDMNCNFYGNEMALAKMARLLNKSSEAEAWERSAAEIKAKLFEYCYDENDAFFYDVDRNGVKRRYRSSTILHLFMERVLDKEDDRAIIDRIYREHIKNPEEFWTPFPFPSMAINDPSVKDHKEFNSWGYYTQGLIVLRCTRWMDHYGYSDDCDYVLGKWLEAWTTHYGAVKFAQEIDPVSGEPTRSSEWYSSCMLAYLYAARRLGLVDAEGR